ncbi:MAG TPA: ATP-binding protein, partial [Candidatus Omnitrophota bacterium]|nr:ATP-binding protein [Candidatus Omnitrophota bacterium]
TEDRTIRTDIAIDIDGRTTLYDTTLEPMHDDQGRVIGVAAACMDVTEIRDAKDALAAALNEAKRANLAKTRFLAAASHDLRQPMQSLVLLLTVLHEKLARQPDVLRAVIAASAAAEAMRGLLDDLLDVARIDAGLVRSDPRPTAIGEMLARLAEEYRSRAQAKGLDFRLRNCDGAAHTDAALLERILRNLLENALRYTESGGILLGCSRRGDVLRVAVVDTGIGMTAEDCEAIFEEFVQLANPERDRTKGLGLGLAIVRRLATLLGHQVKVSSRPGRGSRFYFDLPVSSHPYASLAPLPGATSLCGRVLVIDDERMVLDTLGTVLNGWGLEVVTADSAADGLAKLGGQAPDAILADYRLRGGDTGVQAIKEVEDTFGATIPALIITGDTSPQRLVEAEASGHQLLHKPVRNDELRRRVEAVLRH